MALFEALGTLVASAVLSAAPACDVAIPADKPPAAGDVLAWLRERSLAAPIADIVDALARDIWVGAETRTLSQHALQQHAETIAALLPQHPPLRSVVAQAMERARTGVTGMAGSTEPVARRIAVDIFARARASGGHGLAALRDDVTLFIIDRTFSHLLDDPKVLYGLVSAIGTYAGISSASAPVAKAPASTAATGVATLGVSPAFAQQIESAGGMTFIADLCERFGVTDFALRRILASLDGQGLRPDEQLPKLEETAQWLGDVRAQLQKPVNEDADIRRLKSKAAAALAEGDFEAAAEALRHVRRELREGRRRIEERLQEEVAGLRTQMLEEARATGRLAELAMASGNPAQAAELFADAALSLPNTDRAGIWHYSFLRAEALLRHGLQRNDLAVLGEAHSAYGQVVRQAADGSNQKGLGLASLGLANVLLTLAERESGTARLKDAIVSYRKALQLLPRSEEPRSWAIAQLRFGRALALSGERDRGIGQLKEAAQAFREALRELKSDRSPGDHAQAQMGLGNVLLGIEEQEGGIANIEEAAEAYAAALTTLRRDDAPVEWAEAQMCHGLALLGVGEQKGAVAVLEAAVSAFRAALDGYTRTASPQKWALVQMNLGNALAALGERSGESGPARLEDAIASYSAALQEFRRDAEPLKWAITQMNLGTTLIRLGERRDKRRHWLSAAGALVPALEVFEAQRADAYADVTRRSLKRFHESWEALIAAPVTSGAPELERRPLPRAV